MDTWIVLLRGINVGGKNVLPMRELVTELEGLGFVDVSTYIQSGNVVCRSGDWNRSQLGSSIRRAIDERHGFVPGIVVLAPLELEAAISANPFPEAESEPATLHLFFLDPEPAAANLDLLEGARRESERFELVGKVLYLHAPEGIGRSKLVGKVERALGVAATARNWRTVCRLLDMAQGGG